ncbi:MAG: GYF domain-containing protein [Planctomycetota bacterium]
MSDQWYYQAFGQEFGPLAEDEVARMLLTGELTADDTVREGTEGSWIKAGSVAGLMNLVTSVAVETAEVATDIDSFLLVDEQEAAPPPRRNSPAQPSAKKFSTTGTTDDDYELDTEEQESGGEDEPAIWYFQTFGTELGPVPLSELVNLVERDELSASDAIRMGATGEWITAGEIPALFPHGRKTSPTPTSTSSAAPIQRPAARGPAPAAPSRQIAAPTPAPAPVASAPAVQPAWNAPRTQPQVGAPAAWTAPAAAVDVNWYCYVDEQEVGPLGITELQGLAVSGTVTADVYVKYGAQGEWVLASQVPNLLPSVEPAPANPSQVVFVPVAPAATSPLNLADAERSELVQQLLTLLKKEGLQSSLMGSINTSAPLSGTGWYCDISGSVMGPVSIEALVQMVLQKRIFPDDLIRLGDSGEWFPAKTVPDLFPDNSPGKGKKSAVDDGQNVMDRIDKMYREAQEAKAKQEAANAANPEAKSAKSEPSRSRTADNMLREMSAKLARGKSEAELAAERAAKLEEFMGGLKLDRRSITVLAVIAVVGLGYLLMPILLADFIAGQGFDQLVKINLAMITDLDKGIDSAAWDKKSKDILKTIDQVAKSVRGGTTGSAKRDVTRMATYLKEMVRSAGTRAPGSTEDTFAKSQKQFEFYLKAAKKKLGRK